MYVTCLYDIYNKPEKMAEYIKLFAPLAQSDLTIHLYTSSDLAYHFKDYPSNIKVFVVPLKYLELYNWCMEEKTEMPNERNPAKDTREYLSLMNTKVELLMRSSEVCEDETIIWIDFAILKLFINPEHAIHKFKEFNTLTFDKVNIPGCWYKGEALYLNAIHWRFCGSFIIVPRTLMKRFYNDCKDTIHSFNNKEKILTWEVNVWNHIEYYRGKDYVKWYYALHNDSMVNNLLENIDPWTHKKFEV